MQEPPEQQLPSLVDQATLQEQPFRSSVPLLGPLIAAVRTAWNNVSTKWYARPLLQQQSEINLAVARRLEALETYAYEQISAQDRELVQLRRENAELALALARLQEQVRLLDPRSAPAGGDPDGAEDEGAPSP